MGEMMSTGGRGSQLSLRRKVYAYVEPAAWPYGGLSPFNRLVIGVIVFATILAVLETEPLITELYPKIIVTSELLVTVFFILEYGVRVWVAAENDADQDEWRARVKFFVLPASILDLIVIVTSVLPFFGPGMFLLRAGRLVRILRLASLGGFSEAVKNLTEAVSSRRYELLLSLGLSLTLMLFGATAMWLVEGDGQPEDFGSIPRSLWWALVTLTTIGYGDAFPITPFGKVLAGLVAIAGIGLIALPSGILAAAFSEMARRKGK